MRASAVIFANDLAMAEALPSVVRWLRHRRQRPLTYQQEDGE